MLDRIDITENELAEAFGYLDDLREGGSINMFGARPYVAAEFEFDDKLAGKVVSAWMETFDGETSASDRAIEALAVSA